MIPESLEFPKKINRVSVSLILYCFVLFVAKACAIWLNLGLYAHPGADIFRYINLYNLTHMIASINRCETVLANVNECCIKSHLVSKKITINLQFRHTAHVIIIVYAADFLGWKIVSCDIVTPFQIFPYSCWDIKILLFLNSFIVMCIVRIVKISDFNFFIIKFIIIFLHMKWIG